MFRHRFAALALPPLLLLPGVAHASGRSFVYTQESRVLPPGATELEPWTTFRVGRERYYSRLDTRLELEHGLAPGLQAALYWNFSSSSADEVTDTLSGEIERVSKSQMEGASLELKYQLSDPTADVVGSALYFETSIGPSENELEAKLIFDRALGSWLFAANVTGEYELEPVRDDEGTEVETGFVLEPTLAAAYALPRGFSVGLELRAPLGLAGEAESSTLFGGPVVSWVHPGAWFSLGVQPQLVAFSGRSEDSRLDLEHQERLQLRLLAGFVL